MDKQTENTKFIMQRFDNYVSGVNVKGNFLLAFNTFLTGGIIANYSKMSDLVQGDCGLTLLNIALCLLILTSLVTTVFVIMAVYPYLFSGNSSLDKYHSHIFFNSVAEFENDKSYYESLSALSNDDFNRDLANQSFQLAKGLKKKHNRLEWAMRLIFIELFCILITIIIIIAF